MKICHITDAGGYLISTISDTAKELPKALPWIEPSINCLHQESVLSLLVGNYDCAIMSMCSLMEHVLRLAIINKEECGLAREESISQIDKFNSLTSIIDIASGNAVFSKCDENWWRAVSQNIRNKSAHYLLPTILRNCANSPELKKYISEYTLPENNDKEYYDTILTDWGAFYHKAGYRLAVGFLNDATEEIRNIISCTNWVGDESWWISMKHSYEQFFLYEWSSENILISIQNTFKEI